MSKTQTSVEKKNRFDLTALQIFGSVIALLLSTTLHDARAVADRYLPFQRSLASEITQELIGEKTRAARSSRADKQCHIFGGERRSEERQTKSAFGAASTCQVPMGE